MQKHAKSSIDIHAETKNKTENNMFQCGQIIGKFENRNVLLY